MTIYFIVIVALIALLIFSFGSLQRDFLLGMAEKRNPLGLFREPNKAANIVALTIDDSPSELTGKLLDALKEHGATATFFLHSDQIDKWGPAGEAAVRRMLEEGHEIGNHMPSDTPSFQMEREEFEEEFQRADARLREFVEQPRWFRPAGGRYVEKTMLPSLKESGYEPIFALGSFLPWDTHLAFPKFYAKQIGNAAFPGAILVLHDGATGNEDRAERTLVTLDTLMPILKERGFEAKKLSDVYVGQI